MACVVPVNPGGPFSMDRTPYKLMAVYREKPIPNTNAEINHCKRTKIQNRLVKYIIQARCQWGVLAQPVSLLQNALKQARCWQVGYNNEKFGVESWPLNPYPV